MSYPLQVTFRHMPPSPALEDRIRELAGRLGKFSSQLMRCHVVVDAPHRHQHTGRLFDIRVELTVPGQEIAIVRSHPSDPSHEDAYVALRDAFRAARRKLKQYERAQRADRTVVEAAS